MTHHPEFIGLDRKSYRRMWTRKMRGAAQRHPSFTTKTNRLKLQPTSKPCWRTYYALGACAAKQLPAFQTYEQIGDQLGISHKSAYMEALVALGKVVFLLRRELHIDS